jgi:hypothetical protein
MNFEKKDIPADLKFPYGDEEIFVPPESELMNPKPPKDVLDFFKNHSEQEFFDYDGWKWQKRVLGAHIRYARSSDQRDAILSQVNPYLNTLEKLVGKEVSRADLIPHFALSLKDWYEIPKTSYGLYPKEFDTPGEVQLKIVKRIGASIGELVEFAIVGILMYEGLTKSN